MSPRDLSVLAWGGGAVAGAALSKRHRIAGGALGAMLVGAVSDVLIERHQKGLPNTGAAIAGVAIIALTTLVVSRSQEP